MRMPRKRKAIRVLAAGPKACLHALRSLASVGVASGDTYSILRSPTLVRSSPAFEHPKPFASRRL